MTMWENLPTQIKDKMLERQAEQNDGKRDISVFVKDIYSAKKCGGFDWASTTEYYFFWNDVLAKENFKTFYEKYSKQDYLDKKQFIKNMMHTGLWEDRACSIKERQNAIIEANKLYDNHFAKLKNKK